MEQERIVSAIESYFTRLDAAVASLERVQQNLKRYRASVLKAAVEGRLVPALPLILYAIVARVSLESMFLGGLLPALLMITIVAGALAERVSMITQVNPRGLCRDCDCVCVLRIARRNVTD